MIIRQETPADFDILYQVIKQAFKTAEVSGGTEQDFAKNLRNSNSYIPELALVAEENQKIIGQIMLTKTSLTQESKNTETLLLGPICVLKEYRKKGIAARLIRESMNIAKEKGFSSIVLVGNPLFYSRFGFKSLKEFNITNTNQIPDEYVMGYEITPNALKSTKGSITFQTE